MADRVTKIAVADRIVTIAAADRVCADWVNGVIAEAVASLVVDAGVAHPAVRSIWKPKSGNLNRMPASPPPKPLKNAWWFLLIKGDPTANNSYST